MCYFNYTTFTFFLFQDLAKVLQKNAVAYISLQSPVRGNTSLHPVASPSLQQLVLEVRWTKCGGIIAHDCILLSRLMFLGLFLLSTHKMICKNFEELPAFLSFLSFVCLVVLEESPNVPLRGLEFTW